jgi:hypothetical protein
MLGRYKDSMIFVAVALAWLVSALAMGSLLGRCITGADRRMVDEQTTALDKPLYVADILRAYSAADHV